MGFLKIFKKSSFLTQKALKALSGRDLETFLPRKARSFEAVGRDSVEP
jgi:hypothetical protein